MKFLITILLVLILLLQYDLWFGESSLVTVWKLESSIETQRSENQKLKERNSALAGEVIDLKKGKQAVEERARSELGMIKKGETFIQIVEPTVSSKK
ncbi:Cell division protein DivIC (FtsB), stabilizes FtsL against RasP cleavage [hydrothermal vent metagenome]|uniref:Cell division protein DivIC (FtsB), stabilizes FtsL against RasP cleavage n=1 Tax=hydrothermal vent metagenome TaxID=652676 RepID=A0A3B0ZIY7_9ZZZZ